MAVRPKPDPAAYVESTPGVCGGKPCIVGTRIRVQDVYVWHELQGQSVDQIVSQFPQLTMAKVYAALTYFWDHREEILRQMKDEDALVEAMKARNPSPLREKLARQHDSNDPLPS